MAHELKDSTKIIFELGAKVSHIKNMCATVSEYAVILEDRIRQLEKTIEEERKLK